MSHVPSPTALGLPPKYKQWREHQEAAIRLIDEAKHSTVGMMLPPGAGKSGIYMGWAAWRKKRMCVVVPNKMLQDQVYEDFKGLGMLDLRGQSDPRYTCEVTDGLVSDAPCHGGYECGLRSSCEYFAKLKRAPSEQLIVTNYAFWMHNKGVLGDFDAVVFDEGHQAFNQLAQWSNITFSKQMAKEYFHRAPIRDWKSWASYQRSLTTDMLRSFKDKRGKTADDWDEIRIVKRLHDKLQTLCDADPKTLIYQESHTGWTWDCVWPGAYRKLLTTNAKKYIFTSGTMTRRTFRMLGYAQDEYTWGEFPSTFSIKRCPIFILPAPGLNFHSSASELRLHQEVMDRFLDQFPNWRGLVHSGSYARAGQILLSSRHSARMITHNNSKGLGEAKERFYEQENAILISPAIVEGEDFAYDKARFQVVAKMPFTNPSDPIEAERTRQDEQYPWYTAAQKIMQARGRVMRGEDDFGITAICDGAWDNWFFKRSKHHFTSYFIDAITPLDALSKVKMPISSKPASIQAQIIAPVSEKKLDTPPPTSAPSVPRVALFRANSPKKPIRRKSNVE